METATNHRPKLICGNVFDELPKLEAESVNLIITSPPYFQMRHYLSDDHPQKSLEIGREPTIGSYVDTMVRLGRELRRVLKKDGSFFLNIGDKFVDWELVGIPWKVAFALQGDGWNLVNDIIFHKYNPTPRPEDFRLTPSYEHVFHLSMTKGYVYYLDEIREPNQLQTLERYQRAVNLGAQSVKGKYASEDSQGAMSSNKMRGVPKWFIQEYEKDPFYKRKDKKQKYETDCGLGVQQFARKRHSGYFSEDGELLVNPRGKNPTDYWDFSNTETKSKFLTPAGMRNKGGSPGARTAYQKVFGEQFTVKRVYEVNEIEIGMYLKECKQRSGLTTKQIAELVGVDETTVAHWFRSDEAGTTIPEPENWWKLKDVLKFDDKYDKMVTETVTVSQAVKNNPLGRNPTDYWDFWNIVIGTLGPEYEHYAPFPEQLVERVLKVASKVDDVVLDPFIGSGTTCKVAMDMKRHSIGIDLNPKFIEMSKRRCKIDLPALEVFNEQKYVCGSENA